MELMSQKGFTLIELLIVISIIAILSVIGIVVFTGVQKSSRDATRTGDITAISKAYEVGYNSTGSYRELTGQDFAAGSVPKDPTKGDYFRVIDTGGSGFKACASLENNPNPICNTPATNCYCRLSSQGSIPPGTVSSGLTGFGTELGLGGSSAPACDTNGTLAIGLVGYWKMDEGTGTMVADSSGNGGTLQFRPKAPTWTPDGKSGSALEMYKGSDRSYSGAVANSSALRFSGTQLSFGGWIYLTAMPQSGSYGTFLQKSNSYRVLIYPSGTPLVQIGSMSSTQWGSEIDINRWHFLFVTYDGVNIKFYLDGKSPQTNANNQSFSDNGSSFNVGYGEYPAISGYVDEARVYNRALSKAEVGALANGCLSPS